MSVAGRRWSGFEVTASGSDSGRLCSSHGVGCLLEFYKRGKMICTLEGIKFGKGQKSYAT